MMADDTADERAARPTEPPAVTMRGDLTETFRGLLGELDEFHGMDGWGSDDHVSIYGRAAAAIRALCGEVLTLRREAATGLPAIAPCPACGPMATPTCRVVDEVPVDAEDPDPDVRVRCERCGMSGPVMTSRRAAIEAWDALPRRGAREPLVTGHGDG